MRIAIGSDHAGFELKEALRQWMRAAGHEVIDVPRAPPRNYVRAQSLKRSRENLEGMGHAYPPEQSS